MLKNNIISSFRFLKRNKEFAIINILGLIFGLASFLVILYYVNHELSFDDFHQNHENIYRVNFSYQDNSGNKTTLVNSPPALGPETQGMFPELAKISRLRYTGNSLLASGERSFYEEYGYYADSLFLEIFSFDFVFGDRTTALDQPNSIVLTADLANKYFDKKNPVGSILLYNNIPLKVTGVITSVPSSSHLDFDFLISFSTYIVPDGYASDLSSWTWLGFLTYVELNNGSNPKDFQAKINEYIRSISPENRNPMKSIVQNLSDIYLESGGMTDDLASHIRSGSQTNTYSLIAIAILILIIAGFNFSNLSNAIALKRIKPIGIKKIHGAQRQSIFIELMTETFTIIISCLIFAYLLSISIFPRLAFLMNWDFELDYYELISTFPVLIIVILILTLLAGLYPAILLSGYNIQSALKGEVKVGNRSFFQLKNILVMLQFSISIGLISATLILFQQINHLRNQPVGFNSENVVTIRLLPQEMSSNFEVYKERLLQYSDVLEVSRSDRMVGTAWPFSSILRVDEDPEQQKIVYFNLVDYDYIRTLGIHLTEGRAFSKKYSTDVNNAVIINQKAADLLGLENPLGVQVHFFNQEGPRTIIGVVDDFNYTSLHQGIGPLAMILPFIELEYMYVRLAPGDIGETIELLERTWMEVSSGAPFEWRFLEDNLNRLYTSEEKLSSLVAILSALAVVLACLGLYGMVSYIVNNRIKEFGVRKVLGASSLSLYGLFIKQLVYQIIIAMIIVIPLLIYYLDAWLQKFAYRIEIQWWVFILATFLLMLIAFISMISQMIKLKKTNPANILRHE
jgi:putative ABC transport system permease protein